MLIDAFVEADGCGEEKDDTKNQQGNDLLPEVIPRGTFQNYFTHASNEVTQGIDKSESLQQERHVGYGVEKAGH